MTGQSSQGESEDAAVARPGPVEPSRGAPARGGIPAWLPNAITALRIVLIPVFLLLAVACQQAELVGQAGQGYRLGAFSVLLALGLSDVVDGWLARRFGLDTPTGALLDAIADKLAQVALLAFFTLTPGPAFVRLPVWLLVIIVGRDLVLAAGCLALRARLGKVEVAHEVHGKLSSVLIFGLAVWATLGMSPRAVLPVSLVIAAVVLLSTVDYVRGGFRQARAG